VRLKPDDGYHVRGILFRERHALVHVPKVCTKNRQLHRKFALRTCCNSRIILCCCYSALLVLCYNKLASSTISYFLLKHGSGVYSLIVKTKPKFRKNKKMNSIEKKKARAREKMSR
jgi:hypothetical protein